MIHGNIRVSRWTYNDIEVHSNDFGGDVAGILGVHQACGHTLEEIFGLVVNEGWVDLFLFDFAHTFFNHCRKNFDDSALIHVDRISEENANHWSHEIGHFVGDQHTDTHHRAEDFCGM